METFSSMKTVRSFANEDGESRRYSDRLEDTYRLNKKEAAAYAGFMWTNSVRELSFPRGSPGGPSIHSGSQLGVNFYSETGATGLTINVAAMMREGVVE
ncbi:hypothetical protein chiPu_0032554, partial [Chiloscyllium punctatum]|nr:hypothetical protein [Chiloscyllium punctatum]